MGARSWGLEWCLGWQLKDNWRWVDKGRANESSAALSEVGKECYGR